LLCRSEDGKLQNIEIKTGYNGNFDMGKSNFFEPISFLNNSPCNLALLQVTMGEVLLNKYGITNVESRVWRVYSGENGSILDERTGNDNISVYMISITYIGFLIYVRHVL
jgi:hypothetical protein